jgi:hypothetical protein
MRYKHKKFIFCVHGKNDLGLDYNKIVESIKITVKINGRHKIIKYIM